jgi:integrase
MPRLTEIKIRNAQPDVQDVLLSDGGCLFLRVRPSGSKGWIVRLKRNGKRRVHSIGAYPTVGIKEARAEAAHIVAVERGTARVAVREAVEHYMDAIIRPKYRRVNNAEVYARRLQADLGTFAVDAVRPIDVSRMIADYRRTTPIAAMRMLGFTRQFFAWCVAFGYLERSPVADVRASAFGVEEEARERILTDDELRAFWHAPDLPHRALLRFLLLTGLRIGEAQAARQEWIDSGHWLQLPANVMKSVRPHQAYLSALARTQIEAEAAPALFRSVSPTAVQAALRRWQDRHGVADRWTPHDLRRTFATRLGNLGIAPHVIAKCLAHALTAGGEATPVYLRSEWLDERRHAVEVLAKHVAEVLQQQRNPRHKLVVVR